MGFLSALTQATPGAASGVDTTQYGPTLAAALGNYNNATQGQNQLIQQEQAIAAGHGGPNLADQELLNATQRNTAANAAAIASQRGLNPGLAARQIQTGTADINQQAAGQAAQQRLQQQILAQQQLAGLFGQQQNAGTNLFGHASAGQNQQNTGQIQNQQLEQHAHETDLGASGAAISGLGSAIQAVGQGPLTALGSGGAGALGKGAGGGVADGAEAAAAAAAHGGRVEHGSVTPLQSAFMESYCKAHGGDVVDPKALLLAWHAGREHARSMDDGGEVEGAPAPYPGDDKRNDRIPIIASEGEVVLPRTAARDPRKAAAFIEALNRQEQAKHVMRSSPGPMMAFRPGAR